MRESGPGALEDHNDRTAKLICSTVKGLKSGSSRWVLLRECRILGDSLVLLKKGTQVNWPQKAMAMAMCALVVRVRPPKAIG